MIKDRESEMYEKVLNELKYEACEMGKKIANKGKYCESLSTAKMLLEGLLVPKEITIYTFHYSKNKLGIILDGSGLTSLGRSLIKCYLEGRNFNLIELYNSDKLYVVTTPSRSKPKQRVLSMLRNYKISTMPSDADKAIEYIKKNGYEISEEDYRKIREYVNSLLEITKAKVGIREIELKS